MIQGNKMSFGDIVGLSGDKDRGDILAVSANILDGRGASESWNFGKGFDAGKIASSRKSYDIVPRCAGRGGNEIIVICLD